MKEIERKIFDINPKEVERKLLSMDANKTFDGLVKVAYMDTPDGKIYAGGELLRVREFQDKKVEIDFKTNKRVEDGNKIYDEFTFKADSFEDAVKFLNHVGYEEKVSYEKKRKVFELEIGEVVIDEYPKIDPFIEIEADDPEKIDFIASELGLTDNESSSETITELLERKYPDISLHNLKF